MKRSGILIAKYILNSLSLPEDLIKSWFIDFIVKVSSI